MTLRPHRRRNHPLPWSRTWGEGPGEDRQEATAVPNRYHHANLATTHALERHHDFRIEAAHARRLALAPPTRPAYPGPVAELWRAAAELGARRVLPSPPTASSPAP